MASLWAKYKAEREGKEVLEAEHGFAVFSFPDAQNCYIEDIFVDTDFREQGMGSLLADRVCEIAVSRGATWLIGSVSIEAKNPTVSVKALLAYGMELSALQGTMIYFRKRIAPDKPKLEAIQNG